MSLKVTDPAKVTQMMSTVSVSQLAKSQTLVFDGFQVQLLMWLRIISFQKGTWSNGVFTSDSKYNPVSVNIGDTAYSISDIKDAINASSGAVLQL